MEDIIAIIMVFGTGMVGIIAFSPIGKAIAERLRSKDAHLVPNEDVEDLRAELQGVREQLSELAERQDFTERVVAQQRDRGLVGPAKDVPS
jgi:phosphoglycerate dehydrogenase-like enzyme